MDEVLPGLWVGDLACALSTEYLSLAGVTHIVTALKQRLPPPPTLPCGRKILAEHQRHVSIDDEESEPILVQFPAVNDFLEEVLQERWVEGQKGAPLDEERPLDGKWGHWETTGEGTVLVHCQAGCSRSVALVVAYIMATRKCSRDAALSMVRARRAQAEPNSGFMEQLSLFEQAGYQVDLRHAPIRRFLMSKVDVLNGGSVEDILMSYFPSPAHSPSGSMSGSTLGGRSRRNSSSGGGAGGLNFAPLSSIDGDVDDSSSSLESPRRPMIRRRSRSTVGEGTGRDSKTGKLADLSISPPMPGNTDALFAADAEANLQAGASSSSSWATSITSPHEVLIARSRGFRLPGGVPSIRGHESRSGSGSLPKPDYLRGTPRLRCKMCRRELAARDHIVEHEPGKGIMAFDVKNRRKEMRGPKTAEEVGGGSGSAGTSGQASRGEQEKLGMSQMFGSLRRSRIADSDEDDDEQSAALPDGSSKDNGAAEGQSSEPRQDASPPQVDGQSSGTDSTTTTTTDTPTPASPPAGRPIQSAASLTASLPPHLAALRAGRAPPGTQDAQRKALEDSREKNRIAMERLRGRMGMGGGAPPGGAGEAGAAVVPPSNDGQAQAEQKQATLDRAGPSQQGSGQGQGQGQSRRAILHSPACTSYFLEPLDWMYTSGSGSGSGSASGASPSPSRKDPPSSTTTTSSNKGKSDSNSNSSAAAPTNSSLSSGQLSGKLLCPNAPRCGAKLGNWDWAGMQCGCGAWITPAFAVARGRIDEVWD